MEVLTSSDFEIKTKKAKILLFDIETAPNLAWVWGKWQQDVVEFEQEWYMLSWSAKWLGGKHITKCLADYPGYTAGTQDDEALVKDLWALFEKADILIGHNCVEASTPVLTQELKWVPAGDLQVGDNLVGFEEGTKPFTTVRDENGVWVGSDSKVRKIKPTVVTSTEIKSAKCFEVELSNGDKVITTADHLWLGKTRKDNSYKWMETIRLEPGFRLTKFWNVWDVDRSYDAGWLAGFLAGEGTLGQSGPHFGVEFCQRPGATWDQAMSTARNLGIKVSDPRKVKPHGIGKQDTLYAGIQGGKFEIAEHIGRLQVGRFIANLDWENFGGLKGKHRETVTVVSVREVGYRDVVVLATTTRTFFAAGYAMHNCNKFDIKRSNTRFIEHGLNPPEPSKTIDTLLVAKKHFSFNSNRLDDLGRRLKVRRKVTTGGFALWRGCMEGDAKSWALMKKYNRADVQLLEQVYEKMKPWIDNHPNVATVAGIANGCRNCGGTHFHKHGYRITPAGRQQRYQCQSCATWLHGPYEKVTNIR